VLPFVRTSEQGVQLWVLEHAPISGLIIACAALELALIAYTYSPQLD